MSSAMTSICAASNHPREVQVARLGEEVRHVGVVVVEGERTLQIERRAVAILERDRPRLVDRSAVDHGAEDDVPVVELGRRPVDGCRPCARW